VRGSADVVYPDFGPADWRAMAERGWVRSDDGLLRPDYDPRISKPIDQPGGATPDADMWAMWARLRTIPALVVRGELSDILAPKTLERMRDEKPDLEQVIVPRVGHAPLLTEPVCLEAIDRFLDGLD
jgi:pimeloyl-ACP methyl ester carboxylesterase